MESKGVFKYLDCSTAHITEEDNNWLDNQYTNDYDPLLIVYTTDYGWWVYVPSDRDEILELLGNSEIPLPIRNILDKAYRNECYWVKLDSAGTIHDDLKQYKW